jgi:hypothetical protein
LAIWRAALIAGRHYRFGGVKYRDLQGRSLGSGD